MVKLKQIRVNWAIYLLLVLLAIPASLPLLKKGFYEPHDLHHFADIYQMYRAFLSGQIPPRWGPDFLFGYGYPLFNFYYLIPFYLGALFFGLIGSIQLSFKLVFLLSILLSVWGMYLFLREFVGKWAALAGSILFLYTPYRAVEIYVRGAMGEAFALSLLPFVLWGVVRLIKQPRRLRVTAAISIIIALFILTHNYLWALALPWIVLLVLLLIKEKKLDALKNILIAGLFSIGLTAYWWMPALLENRLVSSITPFPLIDHFPFIKQLIIPSWGYGSSVWGPGDEVSFQVGVVNLAVVGLIISMGAYKLRRHPELVSGFLLSKIPKLVRNDKITLLGVWALVGFFVSIIMMNSRTYFIWKVIPFHNFIQFPWRLLIFTTLFSSILGAALIEILGKRKEVYLSLLIIAASLLLTINYFQPSQIFSKTDNQYLARFFANRTLEGEKDVVSKEYQQYSEDYLLLPKWIEKKPNKLPTSKIEIQGGEVIKIEERSPIRWKAEIVADKPTQVTFHSYYFPGWYAKVDGRFNEIKPSDPYGQIELQVPEGMHSIEFYWAETNLRRTANYISIISLVVVTLLLAGKERIRILPSR